MTDDEARARVRAFAGDGVTERLGQFADLVIAENNRQNLIARSTVPTIWARHILDSIQLLRWVGDGSGTWVDIGTGGGFPGLAIAVATPRPMMLVEPRRQRAVFLRRAAEALGMSHVNVVQSRIETLPVRDVAVISARAVAPIADLFDKASQCASPSTYWLLQRGSSWQSDLDAAEASWKGMFHVEHSLSDPAARIVIATGVTRR